MKNVTHEQSADGKTLIIKIDLTKRFGRSKSGKTEIIATTEGNWAVDCGAAGQVFVGLNVYKYPER